MIRKFGTKGNTLGQLSFPAGIAVNLEGNIVVCDRSNERFQIFSPYGKPLKAFKIQGPDPFPLSYALALDRTGKLVMADFKTHQVLIYSPEGKQLMKFGTEKEIGARMCILDKDGNIVVANSLHHNIKIWG